MELSKRLQRFVAEGRIPQWDKARLAQELDGELHRQAERWAEDDYRRALNLCVAYLNPRERTDEDLAFIEAFDKMMQEQFEGR